MSASREKKNRQAFKASGAADPKAVRAAEEKAKQRKSSILYGSIAVVFVIVAVLVLLWNSNVIQRGKTALTVGDETYTAAQVQYFYHAAYNEVRSSNYFSYMGLDTSKSLSSQTLSDTAKALLGVTGEDSITWDKYLMDKFTSYSQKQLAANAEALAELQKKLAEKGISVSTMLVPVAAQVLSDKLPACALLQTMHPYLKCLMMQA